MYTRDLGGPDDSDMYQLQSSILIPHSNPEDVSKLITLYDEYYPREARVAPLKIYQMMIITWSVTTGSGTAMEVRTVHVLGL